MQYRVGSPEDYLFKVRNLEGTFHAMNEAIMREVVGDRTVTEVLTIGRQEIESRVKERLQDLTNQYEMGITIDQVVLQDVNPPDPVKPSWDEVNQAQQQRDRMINEARGQYNQVIPRARGEAQQAVLQAEGYALDRVNRALGEATRFNAVYEEYRQAPMSPAGDSISKRCSASSRQWAGSFLWTRMRPGCCRCCHWTARRRPCPCLVPRTPEVANDPLNHRSARHPPRGARAARPNCLHGQ